MKRFIYELLSDKGSVSMMRLLSLVCVITASGIAIHAVTIGSDLNATSVLCGTFLGAGIGGKIAQKVTEVKNVDRK